MSFLTPLLMLYFSYSTHASALTNTYVVMQCVTQYMYFFTDIEEVLYDSLNRCNQICTNTIGSFMCECNSGYQLNDNLMTCSGM